MKMPKDFKYDVIQLIRSVRDRPCIWDKSLESHKDRIERRAAWEEVFAVLEPRYEEMSPTEKKTTGDHILGKWTNTRDTFVKSLKTRFGKPKRKYMLHSQLKFLLKVIPEGSEQTGNSEDADCSSTDCNDDAIVSMKYEDNIEEEPVRDSYNSRKRQKTDSVDEIKDVLKKPVKDYDKNENLDFVGVAVDEDNDPRIMNEDEAFFASLLPSVVRYTEDERLEFRIEVLALMRRIKENRNWILGHN